jgi:Cu+-exporting ATPase
VKQSTTIETLCAYCGSVCDSDLVYINGKNFCCYGCATLDDVVAKIKNAPAEVALKYKQLDLAESYEQLVDYQNTKLYKVSVSLPSIHCSSCIELLEDLPSFMDGILSCRVNFEQRKCTVTVSKEVPLSQVAQLLDDIGYPPQISISQKLKQAEKEINRTNLLKLAVAGFCFGNIMLFSMPHYFGLQVVSDVFFARLFSALSIVLSIPVLFYSGRDYLTSAYRALAAGKSHLNIPISIGILSLFGWSLYEIFSGTGIGYLDSLAGLIFFLLIGKWFQHKIYDQVSYHRAVQEFIPLVVRKLENGKESWARLDSLENGDTVLVKNEEIIPVNGIISQGNGLIDYAFITGEAIPESASIGQTVYAGGSQKAGELSIILTEKPSIDKLWSTWNTESKAKEFESSWTDAISKYFTIVVIFIALAAGLMWSFTDIGKALFVFSAVLIVACPCALALSAPFTYGNMLRVYANNQFFIKNTEAISRLSEIEHIVLDKTGTITEKDAIDVRFEGGSLTLYQKQLIKSITSQSTHTLSKIISQYLKEVETVSIDEYEEQAGKGVQAKSKGKVIRIGSRSWVKADSELKRTSVYVSIDEQVVGHFVINATYRSGLKEFFNKLSRMVNLSILSGDNNGEEAVLKQLFPAFKMLKFNLKPQQKAKVVSQLQATEKVLMIGDGLNDSSAIQTGDLGIAITENLNGFYPGSDAVLLSESFDKLPAFITLARYSKKILKWGLVFSLSYNIVGVTLAVLGMLTPIIAAILMPLSSISVVLLDTALVRLKSKKLNLI